MNNRTYLKWTQLHNNLNLRKQLPDIIFNSWEKSYKLNIDNINTTPLICSKKNFNCNDEQWKSLHFYANDILTTTFKNFNDFNIGLGLFDNKGCLVKLYGNEKSLQWLKKNKFEENSIWDENIIGTNAVSLGLKLKKSISVIGEQHFCKFAIKCAMYFSPILFEKNTKDNNEYGGIAIIVPVENNSSVFSITSDNIASAVALHFFWFESVKLFINSVSGYLIINQSNNKNKIIFISNQTFKLLKIPFDNTHYENLEDIIDSYPKNKDFWNIIYSKNKIEDIDIKLSIQKKQVMVNFSIRPFYGRNYHLEGISIIFNSHEKIQKLISNHTGNNANFTFSQIIGNNEKYLNVLKQAKAASQSNINVLLLGESGVGKDIIAQSIHNSSEKKDKPFIVVNCASFPKDLIASELFGYDDGAFTGAKKGGHIGKFELANHGTIFLDEIGDMPLDLQAILLRVIEQKSFMKIGSNVSTDLDIRIIAATNKNLKEKIKKGEFREDLYYRLGIIRLVIPPLRNRQDDILLLTEKFIEKICKRINKPLVRLSPEVKNFFVNYNWPGNVRELKNLLEGVIQVYDDPIINYNHISNYILEDPIIENNNSNESSSCKNDFFHFKQPYIKSTIPNTKEYIINALELNKHNRTNTAKYLGISRNTLYRRLKKYDLL